MQKDLQRSIGTIVEIQKVRPNFTRLLVKTSSGVMKFKAFDFEASYASNRKVGDIILVDWYLDGKKEKYNKVYSIVNYIAPEEELKEERKSTMIISGKITSLNNRRGGSKKSNEVAFTVKSKRGEKVNYCYASSSMNQSRWFRKGSEVQMEVSSIGTVNNHKAYSVITLWEK